MAFSIHSLFYCLRFVLLFFWIFYFLCFLSPRFFSIFSFLVPLLPIFYCIVTYVLFYMFLFFSFHRYNVIRIFFFPFHVLFIECTCTFKWIESEKLWNEDLTIYFGKRSDWSFCIWLSLSPRSGWLFHQIYTG